jgi:thioredoxin 1
MRRKTTAFVVLIVGLGVVTLWAVNAKRTQPPSATTSHAVPDVPAGGDGGAGDLPRLVDLGADKCVPCKMMAPILAEMKEAYAGRLDVEFIDVWKDPAPGREYGVKVIPTQIFFDERGNELFRHQGFMSREDILAKWKEFGYALEG